MMCWSGTRLKALKRERAVCTVSAAVAVAVTAANAAVCMAGVCRVSVVSEAQFLIEFTCVMLANVPVNTILTALSNL
jgi:hypothetical protein